MRCRKQHRVMQIGMMFHRYRRMRQHMRSSMSVAVARPPLLPNPPNLNFPPIRHRHHHLMTNRKPNTFRASRRKPPFTPSLSMIPSLLLLRVRVYECRCHLRSPQRLLLLKTTMIPVRPQEEGVLHVLSLRLSLSPRTLRGRQGYTTHNQSKTFGMIPATRTKNMAMRNDYSLRLLESREHFGPFF